MFIGLMGIDGYGGLYSPKGRYLMRIPFGNSRYRPTMCNIAIWIACKIQTLQHRIAQRTWKT